MKRLTIVIWATFLVLSLGQAVMAEEINPTVGLKLGYSHDKIDYNGAIFTSNQFNLGLSGQFDFSERIGLFAQVGIDLGNITNVLEDETVSKLDLIANISVKYNVFSNDTFTVAVQAGVSGSYNSNGFDNKDKLLFIVPGLYADVNLGPKFNVYTNIKFPIFYYGHIDWVDIESSMGFFKLFLYDVVLGVSYEISPSISLGIEGAINNTEPQILSLIVFANKNDVPYSYTTFNVGLKLNYKF